MSVTAINLIVAAIVVGLVALIDSSVFFISKDTEDLLYYDENSVDPEDNAEDENDEENDESNEEKEGGSSEEGEETLVEENPLKDDDDFVLDIDVNDLAKNLVSDVKKDARR